VEGRLSSPTPRRWHRCRRQHLRLQLHHRGFGRKLHGLAARATAPRRTGVYGRRRPGPTTMSDVYLFNARLKWICRSERSTLAAVRLHVGPVTVPKRPARSPPATSS
jgi:hypothetical protein